jgi:hypothetical protein
MRVRRRIMNLPLGFLAIHHLEHGAGVDDLAADREGTRVLFGTHVPPSVKKTKSDLPPSSRAVAEFFRHRFSSSLL